MMNEKGTLTIGIEHDGKVHKDFILKPQLVRDSIEIMEDERAQKNESYFGICLLAKQIIKLGNIPEDQITPDLIMNLTEVDFKTMMEVKGALETRLNSFRGKTEEPSQTDTGSD